MDEGKKQAGATDVVKLPQPGYCSETSVEKAFLERRSVREYSSAALTLAEVSQLLWAVQGINRRSGGRTAPSAGACYPLEVYLVAGNVENLPAGLYHYRPEGHRLEAVSKEDIRAQLASASLEQWFVRDAPVSIVLAAVYERTTGRYGERGERYVHMDVGHAAQNVHLQAVSLSLGTVVVGAFNDRNVKKVLSLPGREQPLNILPVGRIK